jgi:hypothetical protein
LYRSERDRTQASDIRRKALQPACKPNSVRLRARPYGLALRRDDHSSSPGIADGVRQPTRRLRRAACPRRGGTPSYLVLLRAGFCLPRLLPGARCALTAPFHPYPPSPSALRAPGYGAAGSRHLLSHESDTRKLQTRLAGLPRRSSRPEGSRAKAGGIFSVPLVRRVAPPGNYPAHCPVEFGLSSPASTSRSHEPAEAVRRSRLLTAAVIRPTATVDYDTAARGFAVRGRPALAPLGPGMAMLAALAWEWPRRSPRLGNGSATDAASNWLPVLPPRERSDARRSDRAQRGRHSRGAERRGPRASGASAPPSGQSPRGLSRPSPARSDTAPASCTGCCAGCRSPRPSSRCSTRSRAACSPGRRAPMWT